MKPKKFSLHYWAHLNMERFANGVGSSNKFSKLLAQARQVKEVDGFKYRFKWYIVRNSDGGIIAQSRYNEK